MMIFASALLAASLVTPVTFTTSDGERLGGEVFRPENATGDLPGLLLVHGSGKGNSWRELETEAKAFAAQGLVVMVTDKRSTGYSKTHRDYGQLADDALRAFAVLKRQPGVGKAGIWGLSEGGWVAPIAASRSPQVDYLVTVGGPGLSPLRTQSWNALNKLDRAGVQGSLRHSYASTLHRLAGNAGLFPEAYYDPAATLGKLTQPVLALWGAQDNQVMPAESAERFEATVRSGLTVKFFPGAPHSLEMGDGLAPGYPQALASWVKRVAAGDTPAPSADPLPDQRPRSLDTPASAWWETWPVQLGGMLAMLLAFLWYGVRRRTPGAWHARLVAICGALSIAGMV
ncbi:MAG: alpha/beta hydrolase, partial [Nonomuraea sp.]|nr:alpha/beta hydrolase [Nonomuraea sp.]